MRFCPADMPRGGLASFDTPPCETAVVLAGGVLASALAAGLAATLAVGAGGSARAKDSQRPGARLVEALRAARRRRGAGDGLALSALALLGAGVHFAGFVRALVAAHAGTDTAFGFAVLTDALLGGAWAALGGVAVAGAGSRPASAVAYVVAALSYVWLLREDARQAADGTLSPGTTAWRLVTASLGCLAALLAVWVTLLGAQARARRRRRARVRAARRRAGEAGEPLLDGAGADGESDDEDAPLKLKDMRGAKQWWHMLTAAWTLIWPETPAMKARVSACLGLLVFGRVTNVLVPVVYKQMVDRFGDVLARVDEGEHLKMWDAFYPPALWYCVCWFLGGQGSGFVSNLRQFIWIRVGQDTYKRTYLAVFRHLFDLSLDFHLKRKSGEIIRLTGRGISATQSVLNSILFYILPTIVDVFIACVYFAMSLGPWLALLVLVTIGSYIPLTIAITEWRVRFRRDMNLADNKVNQRFTDALLNYETVKYFNAEGHEMEHLSMAVDKYQRVEWMSSSSLQILNTAQSFVIIIGLVVGLVMVSTRVVHGEIGVGDTVLFISYMMQLYSPLNYFGTYYRMIQQNMVDLENMFDVFEQDPDVVDAPDATELALSKVRGAVEVENVSFAYNARSEKADDDEDGSAPQPVVEVLRGVSFSAPAGSTVALVGSTGSGKSTMLRLLFRSYDLSGGRITLDGLDIASLSQDSLRRAIGVVPQDTVLFNDTIAHNVRYGDLSASDEQVRDACRAAALHDHIVDRFPQKYETVVGERGLRLSGGEKQRVAVARAVLKNAPVLLLDEATSSLDSITERRIQESIASLRGSRTTIVVAHRLSTIRDADTIVFLERGEVKEMGTHEQLLERRGGYFALWERQQQAPASSSASLASLDAEAAGAAAAGKGKGKSKGAA